MHLSSSHLPKFPNFKTLDINDKKVIHEFVSNFPSYTEFNFACMFAWDVGHPTMVSSRGGNLIMKFIDFNSDSYYLSVLGDDDVDDTLAEIFEYCKQIGLDQAVHTVPASTIYAIQRPEVLRIEEDRDNHDYIYQTSSISRLTANEFRGKKNLMNRFASSHGHKSITKEVDLTDPSSIKQINDVLLKWTPSISKDLVDLQVELKAIKKALAHHDILNLSAYGTYVDGILEAFTIFEKVSDSTVLIHFDKANRDIVGVTEHLKNKFSSHLSDKDIALFNFSQDLGYPGLRSAKLSYHPVGFLKKYSIHPLGPTSSARKTHARQLHGDRLWVG